MSKIPNKFQIKGEIHYDKPKLSKHKNSYHQWWNYFIKRTELKKDADFGTREINRLTISGKIAEAINLRPLVLEYKDLIAKLSNRQIIRMENEKYDTYNQCT